MDGLVSTDRTLHEIARRMALRCRRIVQACLREEEWIDADREFYMIIREELERWKGSKSA